MPVAAESRPGGGRHSRVQGGGPLCVRLPPRLSLLPDGCNKPLQAGCGGQDGEQRAVCDTVTLTQREGRVGACWAPGDLPSSLQTMCRSAEARGCSLAVTQSPDCGVHGVALCTLCTCIPGTLSLDDLEWRRQR